MIEVLMIVLMVFAATIAVGYPLVNPARYRAAGAADGQEPHEKLWAARNRVYDALRDLELDHATSKLSDADYQSLRTRYELKAAAILQQLDALESAQAKRAAQATGRRQAAQPLCRHCHARCEPGDHYCQTCGAEL